MKTHNKTDLYDKIRSFQQTMIYNKPTKEEMIHEVQMMNFKVKPVYGNLTFVDFNNYEFIDALWSLGKLDEFFRVEFPNISEDDRDIFYRLIDEIRVSFQQKLNSAYVTSKGKKEEKAFFEIEIYKDITNFVN